MNGLDEITLQQIFFNRKVLLGPSNVLDLKNTLGSLVEHLEKKVLCGIQLLVSEIGELGNNKESIIRGYFNFLYWPLNEIKNDWIVVIYDDFYQKKITEKLKDYPILDTSDTYVVHDPRTRFVTKIMDKRLDWLKLDPEFRFHPGRLLEVPEKTTPEKFLYRFGI